MGPPKGKKIVLAGLALTVAVLAAAAYSFRGLAVEQRLLWKLDSRDHAVAKRAAEQLAEMGSARAIPRFIEQKRGFGDDAKLLNRLMKQSGRRAILPLQEFLSHRPSDIEGVNWFSWAIEELEKLEPGSPEVLDASRRLLETKGVKPWHIESILKRLENAGENTVPVVISLMKIDDREIRNFALTYLQEIGPDAEAAIPTVLELLEKKEFFLNSALALVEMGGEQERLIPRLNQMLKSEDPQFLKDAPKVIARIGKDAKGTIPLLIDRIDRLEPKWALEAMEDEAVPSLIGVLQAGSTVNKVNALKILTKIGSIARAALPQVRAALEDSDPDVSLWAALALDSMGNETEHERILPVLVKGLKKEKGVVWNKVISAIQNMGPDARDAVSALMEEITTRKGALDELRDLILTLGMIGPSAKSAIPYLITGLDDPAISDACSFSLLKMVPHAREAIPTLEKMIEKGIKPHEEITQAWAAAALIAMEPERAASLLPKITSVLKSESEDSKASQFAAVALRNLRQVAKAAVPDLIFSASAGNLRAAQALEEVGIEEAQVATFAQALMKGSTEEDLARQRSAAEALCWIGPPAKVALPALIQALGDSDGMVRQLSAKAIGRLGPKARTAIAPLKALSRDHKKAVRAAARAALERIQVDS